jgi:hypothetical protein
MSSSSIYPRRPILRSDKWNRENNPYTRGTSAYYRWKADFQNSQAEKWGIVTYSMIALSVVAGIASIVLRMI